MESIRSMLISCEMQIGMSATILIALIVVTFKLSSYIGAMKNDIKNNTYIGLSNIDRLDKVELVNDDMGKEHNLIKITQAVLETKLENIVAGVEEIKALLVTELKKNK